MEVVIMSYKDKTKKYAEIGRRMRDIPQEKTASSYEWIKISIPGSH
jgi:hypothetical protein